MISIWFRNAVFYFCNSWFFFSCKCIFTYRGLEREFILSRSCLIFLFASSMSSLISFILTSLPDWALYIECFFWLLKYLKWACLTWLNNFAIMVKLLDSSSWYTMWSWTIPWAVNVVVYRFYTSRFLLTPNLPSTWACPCDSISKILKSFHNSENFVDALTIFIINLSKRWSVFE